MSDIRIVSFSKEYEERWDRFVLNQSANGTMLQTRKFLNYHPSNRFLDSSIIFLKGTEIIAVIPANLIDNDDRRVLYSHTGSTFGGIIIDKRNIKVSVLECLFELLDQYCLDNNLNEIRLKMTSPLYSRNNSELLDYFLFNHGYKCSLEVGYYINFDNYNDDIPSNYSASVRRHYKAALKNGLSFKEMNTREEISLFYDVLIDNYRKFKTQPVHSLEELFLLKEDILKDRIRFYGVFQSDEIVASSMVFEFDQKVFHTQYLASKVSYSNYYVNEFLYTNLIMCAKENKFTFLSFGTTTLDGGKTLNYNLAQYKEQYGTDQYVNRTYSKVYK